MSRSISGNISGNLSSSSGTNKHIKPPVWVTASGSLGSFNAGDAVAIQLGATDPQGLPLAYALARGNRLPSGCSLSSQGLISGIMTQVSADTTTSFTIVVSNGSKTASRIFSLTDLAIVVLAVPSSIVYTPAAPSLQTSVVAGATVGTFTVAMSDGTTYTGSNTLTNDDSGNFSVAPATGNGAISVAALSGLSAATHTVTLQATQNAVSISADLAITVVTGTTGAAPVWVTPAGFLGSFARLATLSIALQATDPNGLPLTYSISAGSLPSGITLSSAGLISGTLPAVSVDTTSNFTVSVTNGTAATAQAFSLTETAAAAVPGIAAFSLINTAGTTRVNEPFTYGAIFKDGDIPAGTIPQLQVNAVPLTTQSVDQVTAWPSGAMKRCVISGIVPSFTAAGLTGTLSPVAGAPNTSGITLAAFQTWAAANSWNVSWEATVAGTLFTANADTALAGSAIYSNSAAHYAGQWLKNNVCTEFVCSVPLKTAGAVQHRILRAFFHIRAYHPGGVIQDVRADAFLQNGDVGSIGNGFVLFDTLVLKQNGTQVWSRTTRSPAADLTVPGTPVDPNTTISISASGSVFTASDVGRLIESNGGLCLISSQTGNAVTGLMFYGDGSPTGPSATLAKAQVIATGAGTLSLNAVDNGNTFNACVRSGTAYIRAAGMTNVRLYSASGHAGIVYTVNGTRRDGTTTAETITGSAATFALGAVAWDTITSMTYTGGAAQTVSVGQGGLPASVANGTWRVVGFYMPSRTRTRNFRTWHGAGARNAPQYDTTYLIGTKQIPNYDFAVRSSGQWATLDAANLTTLNGYPTSSGSALFPDSADYNLYPNNEFNYFGYQCHQGNGGASAERAVFGPYEVTWLNQMTANAWRNMIDRAISVFAWPVWTMDENTGKAVDPADRPTLSVLVQSSSAVFPVFVSINEMQLIIDEIEHMGAKAAMMSYMFTGDLCWHEGYQYESMWQWMAFNPGSRGNGYTRNTMFPSERGMAWRLRHMAQLLSWYPDTLPAGFVGIQPKATIQAMFEGGTSTTGLVQNMNTAVTTGSDLDGVTPAQKGNWHYVTASADGPARWAAFQMSYLSMVLGHAYDNQVLGSAGTSLFTYNAALPPSLINDTASVHPRYFSVGPLGDNWMFTGAGASGGGAALTDISAGYSSLQNTVFPTVGLSVNGSHTVPVATTLTATSGASVTMTFGTTQVLSGSDMVGAKVADAGTGRGTITAVAIDGKSCTVNIPGGTPFSGTSLGSNIVRIGVPSPGANTGATLKQLATDTGYSEAAYDLYGALASIAALPAQTTAAKTAHANLKTWVQNDGLYLASSWSFEAAQYMINPR